MEALYSMTKIDIFSGFLGAGKTTLIRKLIQEGYKGEKLVLIENEFGDIAIDGGFLQDAGVEITEMNSGCICCTLVGDFTKALKKVIADFAPDRILIEPSGVGKLSDVAAAVERVEDAKIGSKVTVVDAGKAKMYARNFGEFFNDQVSSADLIVMSRTDTAEKKVLEATELLKEMNPEAGLITTPWAELDGAQILAAMEENGLRAEMEAMKHEKAQMIYDIIDNSRLYKPCARVDSRSDMNVTFRTGDAELDALFAKEGQARGLMNLKGHRSVGGIRASLYNAQPMEGVKALAAFMKEFEVKHHV